MLNGYICSRDRALTDITFPSLSSPRSNGFEGVAMEGPVSPSIDRITNI